MFRTSNVDNKLTIPDGFYKTGHNEAHRQAFVLHAIRVPLPKHNLTLLPDQISKALKYPASTFGTIAR